LRIDGALVGQGGIARTIPAVIETSGEGQCCGYDSGLPVSASYESPFRFTGTIKQVVVETDSITLPDNEALLRAAAVDY